MYRICFLWMCLLVILLPAACRAEPAEENNPSDTINIQVEELQELLEQIRSDYENRISELETRIDELSAAQKNEEDSDSAIQEEEEYDDDTADDDETVPEDTVFQSGSLSLQALNPEISVVGDSVSWYGDTEGDARHSDFGLRVLGLHFESYLDPYSKFKACVPVKEEGAELGEAYLTRYSVTDNLNVTLGKFHQQFGIVNRWHVPSLDQVEYPLALRQIFGGPLESTGFSFDWLLPQFTSGTRKLYVQLTNGANNRLFGGNTHNYPSLLLHHSSYRDISKDLYFENGLTALAGRNDQWQTNTGGSTATIGKNLWTYALGADFTFLWEPTDAMRYKNWLWRTETYYLCKNILAPDGSGEDTLKTWGAYSYFQRKMSRTTEAGLRFDYYKPDVKGYANVAGLSLSPLAVTTPDAHQWQVSPYVTWWQSPWVKWRFEYDHRVGKGLPGDDKFFMQCTFAAGPHKHERY